MDRNPLPRRAAYVVRSVLQARALASPIRLRILEAFTGPARTTMQVAELLGLPPTRLYRHVEALRQAGLLVPRGEQRKRGTVEKYLQAVARRIEVDSSVLAAGKGDAQARQLLHPIFANAERKAVAALSRTGGRDSQAAAPLVAGLTFWATPAEFAKLRRKLAAWLALCGKVSPDGVKGGGRKEHEALVVLLDGQTG